MLYERGIPLRPDWEVVIKAVVDFAETLPLVDAKRIALSGWSLGGYLAPRGASGEPRIAATIADPGTWSIAEGFREVIVHQFDVPPKGPPIWDNWTRPSSTRSMHSSAATGN